MLRERDAQTIAYRQSGREAQYIALVQSYAGPATPEHKISDKAPEHWAEKLAHSYKLLTPKQLEVYNSVTAGGGYSDEQKRRILISMALEFNVNDVMKLDNDEKLDILKSQMDEWHHNSDVNFFDKYGLIREIRWAYDQYGENDHINAMNRTKLGEYYSLLIVKPRRPYGALTMEKLDSMQAEDLLNLEIKDFRPEEKELYNCQLDKRIDEIKSKYTGMDVTDVDAIERDLMVKYYEARHPDNAKKIKEFLTPVSKCGSHDDEIQDIKYLAYASPEPYHFVFFKYLPKINIREHHESGTQYFQVGPIGGKNVYIDIGRVITESGGPGNAIYPGGYTVFFHEIGHAIDYIIGDGKYCSVSLNDEIVQDVEDNLRAYIASMPVSAPLTPENIQQILDSLQKGQTTTGDADLDKTRTDVTDYYRMVLHGGEHYGTSDVYGGATGNNILGTWGHTSSNNGDPYWDSIDPSVEFFASAFSHYLTGYSLSIQSIETYLPTASTEFIKIMEADKNGS